MNSPATYVSSVDTYTPDLSIVTKAWYVLHGSKVYKFYLSHRNGEANVGAFDGVFQQLVTTAQFTE